MLYPESLITVFYCLEYNPTFPAGTSQHLLGARSCVPCQFSTYQNLIGQKTCKLCRGTVTQQHTCLENGREATMYKLSEVSILHSNISHSEISAVKIFI